MEIIGGKHFKTPDGEFVELKSGTQYKIHVKNSHAYSKDAYPPTLSHTFQSYNPDGFYGLIPIPKIRLKNALQKL